MTAEIIDPLWRRLRQYFPRNCMYSHSDNTITVKDNTSGAIESTKPFRLVCVINVKEHYRHLAACVPNFGDEWKIIAQNFAKLHKQTTDGLGLTWGHRTLGMEGESYRAPEMSLSSPTNWRFPKDKLFLALGAAA
jgi:hypothetical protein